MSVRPQRIEVSDREIVVAREVDGRVEIVSQRAMSVLDVVGTHTFGCRLLFVGSRVPERVRDELQHRYVAILPEGPDRDHNAQMLGMAPTLGRVLQVAARLTDMVRGIPEDQRPASVAWFWKDTQREYPEVFDALLLVPRFTGEPSGDPSEAA